MIELILVMVLVGVLGAIGAVRFFSRTGFDAAAYAEQVKAMTRYAQKLAVAQNRNVYVEGTLGGVALCYVNALPCPAASQVAAPAGSNSGSDATRAFCSADGAYASTWYCEGVPTGVTMAPVSGSMSPFYFSGLGKPYLPADPNSGANTESTFTGLAIAVKADGGTSTLSIAPETGYVY